MTEGIAALRTILPLGLTAGINLYLTILVVGLSMRFGWAPAAPSGLEALATLPVLIGAGVFYLIEFVADKIAFVDDLWDLIHTFIRPIGAVLIATASLTGLDPAILGAVAGLTGVSLNVGVVGALVAGVTALVAHGGKAGTRVAVNVASPAETVSNIVVSLIEDVAVALIAFLALRFPVAANVIAVTLLVLIVVFVPQLLRWAWFMLRAVLARLRAFVTPLRQPEPLPVAHRALLGGAAPDLSARCQAQNLRGANGRYGYLALTGDRLDFTYDAWFRSRVRTIAGGQIRAVQLQQRALMDVLMITYGATPQQHMARFAFAKDRAPLVKQFVARLEAAAQAQMVQ